MSDNQLEYQSLLPEMKIVESKKKRFKLSFNFDFSDKQRDRASQFFVDLAKIVVASVVLGFFIPGISASKVSLQTFLGGLFLSMFLFLSGLKIISSKKL